MAKTSPVILSHTGHPLTVKEDKFISVYIETGNGSKAMDEAGYTTKAKSQQANRMLNKPYIAEEIAYRMSLIKQDKIASAEEIMEYFSAVMRGEVKDQFEMDPPLSERTKAAQELAKRQIDMVNKVNSKDTPEVRITLDWGGIQSVQTISDVMSEE